ncbi:ABC transporter permease [Alkalihalobacillus sp. LMS39]|uniref:ABC transporter permease n=1 Tax=Alkalihalobacillus sp. LMS39 TaxID=2924032 RepID=UPI001FB52F7A|nr:ABC transporter permease [Alkalihalobacillus sp. LMS39]UOE94068.1 ABC transporter permease [Alkalihalobacillus sp. LMS39]
MNFIKRGLLSITRNKGKSIILLAIILILGNLIAGAISIQQATTNVEKTIKERMGTAATVELDYDSIWNSDMTEEEMMNVNPEMLTLDMIKQIGELSQVKYYDYSSRTHLGSEHVKSVTGYEEEDIEYENPYYETNFMLKGVNYAPIIDFEEGKNQLVDGRVFTNEEVENGAAVTVISKKLAELNNLHVGDTFILTSAVIDYQGHQEEILDSRDLPLEIIGLFEPVTVERTEDENNQHGMWDFMDMDKQNTVYVANSIVLDERKYDIEKRMELDEEFRKMVEEEGDAWLQEYYQPIYILNSTDDAQAFAEDALTLVPEYYVVRHASDQYDSISGPIKSMSKLSGYVLIVSVAASILIIGLVVLLFLRDRRRELGIYLSLGERRGRVIGQIVIEVFVIALIGITLSLFTGNLIASGVSGTLMQSDTTSQDEFYYYGDDFTSNLTTSDVLNSYEVELSPTYILMFIIIGLATVLFSTIIPLIYIVRLNPKKILM